MAQPQAMWALGLLFLLQTAAGSPRSLLSDQCPPPGFDAVKDIDIREFISQPWYVQAQVPLAYQPADQLYCVRAQYTPLADGGEGDPLEGLRVNNYANRDQVNGEPVGTGGDDTFLPLIATVPDASRPAKLLVGPDLGFIPGNNQIATGDYWIVYLNKTASGSYDLAIISGGLPTRETDSGLCATGNPIELFRRIQVNNIGLWLFSRKPVDPEGADALLSAAESMGLDTSELVAVQQEGCRYEGA